MWPIEFIKWLLQYIDEEILMDWRRDLTQRIKKKSVIDESGLKHEELEVIVELPQGLFTHNIRKLKVKSPLTIGKFSEELAAKYNVDKNNWRLLGSIDVKDSPKILPGSKQVSEFRLDKNEKARLYFRPETIIR